MNKYQPCGIITADTDETIFDQSGIYIDITEMKRMAELERIEYLITCGAKTEEVMKMFPQYEKCIIDEIVKRVSWFCWLSDEEAATRTINGKDYVVKSVFSDSGKDIKSTIIKLAERKAIREMGLDMSAG